MLVEEVNDDHVVWDSTQWSRSNPLTKQHEISTLDDFDLAAEFEAPSLSQEFSVSLAEHEVLLSFNDDEHAESFGYWWQQQGLNDFAHYLLDNKLTED